MPAQKKVTRDVIIKAAYEILRKNGVKAVNARSIAKKLGSSTQPIYHAFASMGELKAELINVAEQRYRAEVLRYMAKSEYSPYMAYGLGFVFLAKKESELFRFLFMTIHDDEKKGRYPINSDEIIKVMREDYGYTSEAALALHEHMSIYAYGLAYVMNTGVIEMNESNIVERFHTEFLALCAIYGQPIKKAEE